jgi:hypothetical protein
MRCRFSASLYGPNVTRSLSEVAICLSTVIFQFIEYAAPNSPGSSRCPVFAADCAICETSS